MDSDASLITSQQGSFMRASKTFTVLPHVMERACSRS